MDGATTYFFRFKESCPASKMDRATFHQRVAEQLTAPLSAHARSALEAVYRTSGASHETVAEAVRAAKEAERVVAMHKAREKNPNYNPVSMPQIDGKEDYLE